jgi:hypothetical protein
LMADYKAGTIHIDVIRGYAAQILSALELIQSKNI